MRNTLTFLVAGLSTLAFPACDIKITSITSCDSRGATYFPKLGEAQYGLRINWTVTGTASTNYTVRFKIGDQQYDWTNVNAKAPGSYFGYRMMPTPLDGNIPVFAKVDVDGVTGDTNSANNSMSGTIIPAPISGTVEYYDFKFWNGFQRLMLTKSGVGTFSKVIAVLGRPVNATSQGSVVAGGISGGTQLNTLPFNDPVHVIRYFNPAWTVATIDQTFRLRASSVRINTSKFTQPWGGYTNLPSDVQPYSQPEARIRSTDPLVTAFVNRNLPQGFKGTHLPIDAARVLFKAVAKEFTTSANPTVTATQALTSKVADSYGLSLVYAAAMRNIGVPCRVVTGWASGANQWKAWSETWFPSVGWVPQDVSLCEQYSPLGNLAYGFATVPELNQRAALSRATAHVVDTGTYGPLWKGEYFYWRSSGSASFRIQQTCTLYP